MTLVDDYLARLGLEREPPSVEALFRLHRAHVERVPGPLAELWPRRSAAHAAWVDAHAVEQAG